MIQSAALWHAWLLWLRCVLLARNEAPRWAVCLALTLAAPQELVGLINSRLPEGVEPLHVGAMPRWQLALPDLKK